jgi:DNA-binding response OmpR family regulator
MDRDESRAAPVVLIVEDEEELAQSLCEYLGTHGCEAQRASNGAEALRAIMTQDYAAIICDMVMPRMAGDMFYRAVQRVRPDQCDRFVFVTGYSESPRVREFLASIGGRAIMKPFNLDDLWSAMTVLLERQRAEGTEAAPAPDVAPTSQTEDAP